MGALDLVRDIETDQVWLNMGPQHPSTHGVFRVLLKLDGEVILQARPVIGYLHRGTEKIAENRMYFQIIPYMDRLDYLSAMGGNLGLCLAVEKIAGIEVPKRSQYIRVLAVELNRIASHLVWLGTWGLDLGVLTPFLYCFREREEVLALLELMSGARLTYSYITYGGVRDDLVPEFYTKCKAFLKDFPHKIEEYHGLMGQNEIFKMRTQGIGILPKEVAISHGCCGPVLRGSGVNWDLRKNSPYCSYEDFQFDVPVGTVGDIFDRYLVRMEEMRQSVRIVEQALEGLPEGDYKAASGWFFKVPKGEAYTAVEQSRGEFGVYVVSDGSAKPYRLRLRSPAFSNLSVVPYLFQGWKLGDVVAILGSLDPVFGDV
ncbi:MAG: NADH-quinone oxidoreductase subunit D, partial [bacterium]